MCKLFIMLTVLVLIFSKSLEAANILHYLGVSTYSSRLLITPYLEELARKGHNVTLFSPYASKSNNSYIDFSPQILQNYIERNAEIKIDIIKLRKLNVISGMWWELGESSVEYCSLWLNDAEVLQWIDESHFDLVVVDSFFSECGIGLAYKFKAPHIIFATMPNTMWQHDIYGIPPETSWIPDMQYGDSYPLEATLIQRTINTLRILYWHFYRKFSNYPEMESMLRKHLKIPDMPPLDELTRKPSAVLVTHHYSVDYAKSLPPLCIPISGLHVIGSDSQPLPQKFENFINGCGENGFIYMSFGSYAEVHSMPDDLKIVFLKTFEKLSDICFLVKWEGDRPKKLTKNVFTSNWMPQKDILAHPRVRAFMTHAGLLGIQEAVYHSVPLIAFPLFGEQDYNAEKIHRVGYGIKFEITTLTQSELYHGIQAILKNNRYKEKMNVISKLYRDRPDEPLQTAVWWTEFALRHTNQDDSMIIPLAAKQTWYERRLLDVWALVLLLIIAVVTGISYIMIFCFKILFRCRQLSVKKKIT